MSLDDFDFMKQASQLFAPEQQKKEWYEELEEDVCQYCPKMTMQQRLLGCLVMMLVGFLISMGSMFRLMQLLQGNPTPFAVMYTLGNLVSICSTCFLYGPWTQLKSMCATTRLVTTSVYFLLMFLCLFLALYPGFIPVRALWLVLAILGQFIALVWYTLSFIPFARTIILHCLSANLKLCGCNCVRSCCC